MGKNLLIVHGGGPTAVINASLYGAVMEAKASAEIGHVYGARGGTGGLMDEKLVDLGAMPDDELALLLQTPGSAIGSSRDALEEAEYQRIADVLQKYQIDYVLMNGGNGSMDTCGKIYHTCRDHGMDVLVCGIPKTMDNDLSVTDHSPGYGSAARYLAQSVKEVAADVHGLPIHVVVIEALGRNAGWVTAAAALAEDEDGLGPDLIYLPEVPFDDEKFLAAVSEKLKTKKGLVVVASEGLRYADGTPIVDPVMTVGRATYFGGVSEKLANLVIKHLGYKARSEKPGLLGRASMACVSPVDQEEAEIAGREAVRAVLAGETGKMVAFRRVSGAEEPYRAEPFLVPIEEVMMYEKTMPKEFIKEDGSGVTEAFKEYARPLIGGALPRMLRLE